MSDLLKTEKAARKLAVSKGTLRNLVNAGLIKCVRVNARCWRFTEDALQKFVDRKEK